MSLAAVQAKGGRAKGPGASLRAWLALALGAATLLSACGKAPTAPPAYEPPVVNPLPQPSASPGTAPNAEAEALLAAVTRAQTTTQTWKADARTDMRLPDGTNDFNLSRMRFRRPGWMRGEILQAKNGGKKGTVVVFDGKREVRVKTYLFGLLPLRVTLDVRDERLLDPYKRSLAETGTEALLATFVDPKATRSYLGESQVAGETVALVDVVGGATYKGIARDRYGISRRLNLPIMRDSYDAQNRLIYHCELRQMQVNVAMSGKDFTTD